MLHLRLLGYLLPLFTIHLCAQVIPPERVTDWSDPGARAAFTPQQSVSITAFGADPTGIASCNPAMLAAIAALGGPGEVFFPAGVYRFAGAITLPDSIILQGASDPIGQPLARLLLGGGENADGIRIMGSETAMQATITNSLEQGDRYILVDDPSLFQTGLVFRLQATDDSALVYSAWSLGQTGQILEVTAVVGDTVKFDRPLRRSYSATPLLRRLNPRRQVHLRCLALERTQATTSQTANVFVRNGVDCSMTGLRSELCNYAHINLFRTTRTTVANSYFKNAHAYGSGGKAYGVLVDYASGDNFIHQNNFEHLRHAMLVQAGANGNVFAYNRSVDPFWSSFPLPANAAGDLVLHGNYPYMNLFEGNVVQNIVIDNSHAINGPYNTLFRNRAELYGIFMNSSPASNNQNFIGNQVTNTTAGLGLYSLQGTGHFSHGNQIKGNILPAGTSEPVASSLFNYAFSDFYTVHSEVPPIRTDNWQSAAPLVEAQYRREILQLESTCSNIEYISTTTEGYLPLGSPMIYPNPADSWLRIDGVEGLPVTYSIIDCAGRELQKGLLTSAATPIDVQGLAPGLYMLRVHGITLRFVRGR